MYHKCNIVSIKFISFMIEVQCQMEKANLMENIEGLELTPTMDP